MGSRADDKLKEIDELRDGLSKKLDELEQKFPLGGFGKKAALAIVGSSVSAPALAWGMRRLRGGGTVQAVAKGAARLAARVSFYTTPQCPLRLDSRGHARW